MRRCVTCEGLLDDSLFPADGPVCKACVGRLQRVFNVDYSPPKRKTVREAHIALLLAIREQAEKDGELDDWEEYWLEDEAWSRVWQILQYAEEQSVVSNRLTHNTIGGFL